MLAYGRRRAHAGDWAPSLRIEAAPYGPEKTVIFGGRLAGSLLPPSALADLAGSDITIVGRRLTPDEADMSALGSRSTLLLDGAIALVPETIARPLALLVEDERFVYRHFRDLMAGLDRSIPCLLSVAVVRAILEQDPDWLIDRPVILIDNLLKPYGENRRALAAFSRMLPVTVDAPSRAGVSLDPMLGVFQARSAVVPALQFALFCRPRIIGFVGVDISDMQSLRHIKLAKAVGEPRGAIFVTYSRSPSLETLGIPYSDRLIGRR